MRGYKSMIRMDLRIRIVCLIIDTFLSIYILPF